MSDVDEPAMANVLDRGSRPQNLAVHAESGGASAGLRFAVELVEEPTSPERDSVTMSHTQLALSPSESHNRTTLGYNTAEAVPMTVFYRNLTSQAHAKTRPTLAELHGEVDDAEQVSAMSSFSRSFGDFLLYPKRPGRE